MLMVSKASDYIQSSKLKKETDEISVNFENHEIRMEIQYLNYIATSSNAFHIVWKVFTNHDIF